MPLLSWVLIVAIISILSASTTFAREMAAVWLSPDGESPDYLELFTQPQRWPESRGQVDVFKFGPYQLSTTAPAVKNSFQDLLRVDAFRQLQRWGIDIAIEAPAVKEWDCSGRGDTMDPRVHGDARGTTLDYIKNVYQAGGSVRFIAMDNPMTSGLGTCLQTIDETSARTAAYAKALLADSNIPSWAPHLAIGDIEAYPSKTVDQLKRWIQALKRSGFQPVFLHLDVDVHDVDIRGPKLNLGADLQSLKAFFHAEGIPFGVIFWSGYDPERSDFSYYKHVLTWAARVHAAIGRPEQSVFQSWVRRSSINCTTGISCSTAGNWACSSADPAYCGKLSMPINLPENDPAIFSLTRIVIDTMSRFK